LGRRQGTGAARMSMGGAVLREPAPARVRAVFERQNGHAKRKIVPRFEPYLNGIKKLRWSNHRGPPSWSKRAITAAVDD